MPELTVHGDADQWGVALENLLDNQLRYAEKEIHIRVRASGQASASLRLWNDGPPLEEAAAERMFEPFATGKRGEFGLGLAIVKQIAAYHGLKLRAVNESGGVAFYME